MASEVIKYTVSFRFVWKGEELGRDGFHWDLGESRYVPSLGVVDQVGQRHGIERIDNRISHFDPHGASLATRNQWARLIGRIF